MTNELKIKISADLDDLKKGLSDADRQVEGFSSKTSGAATKLASSLDNASASSVNLSNATEMSADQLAAWDAAARRNQLEQYDANVRKTTKDVKALATAQQSLSGTSKKLGGEIRANSAVATEFSRIVQDAPYGIIGVGNNITQLTQSFANLRAQTGSTSKALKMAFTGLFSGTNLLVLGISAVTTAFTLYSMYSRKAKKDTEDLDDGTKRYIDTLEGVARAQADGAVNAQKDLAQLRLLYSATQNQTLAMEDRRKAAEELIRQYPKQFEGLTAEKVLAGEAADAYDRLSKSLVATARASAVYSKVADNQAKILDKQLRIADLAAEQTRLQAQRDAQQAAAIRAQQQATGLGSGALEAGLARRAQAQVEETQKRIRDGQLEIAKLTTENNDLQEYYNKLIADGADLSGRLATGLGDAGKKTKEESDKLAEALVKNEERVQTAIRTGRDKEIEEARIRYENLYKMAGDNAAARVQIAEQEADEIAAINRKYDEKAMSEALKVEQWKWNAILKQVEKAAKDKEKVEETARKKREKAEKDLAKRIYEENLYYSQQLGNAVGNALEDALGRGENFFKALRDEFKRTLIRMAADAAAAQIGKAIMAGISSSSGGKGGGFWGFLGGLFRFGSNFFKGSGYSSGSFPTGNYGGGNFPATNPIRGGGFVPGIQSSSKPLDINVTGVMRGQDIMMTNNRATKFNDRFNGGQ